MLVDNLFLQFSKITDPAGSGRRTNLTTNYLLEKLPWPNDVRAKLAEINGRLLEFRKLIEPARSKRIAHVDFAAQIERHDNLGAFTQGREMEFLQDLQAFLNTAFGHFHNGDHRPIAISMSTDTHKLVRALEKSVDILIPYKPKIDAVN
jgi:hypothetical protein